MLISVNGLNEKLERYISNNYTFRKNLVNKILGEEDLEYKRADVNHWSPISKFLFKEKNYILSENKVEGQDGESIYPDWLIKKVALKQTDTAPEYIENQSYAKLLELEPVKVFGQTVIKSSKREAINIEVGDTCFVSFGRKKKYLRKYHIAIPAVVESITVCGQVEYYNVFMLKINRKRNRVEYFGRHMVMKTEVGRTPEEAASHVAYSQAIY